MESLFIEEDGFDRFVAAIHTVSISCPRRQAAAIPLRKRAPLFAVCLPQVSADPGCSGDAELLFLFI